MKCARMQRRNEPNSLLMNSISTKPFLGYTTKPWYLTENSYLSVRSIWTPDPSTSTRRWGCSWKVSHLGRPVAESIEQDISPGNSWQVILKDDGHVAWVSLKDGVTTEVYDSEPMSSAERLAEADALALIPDSSEM
jgi:hypothetical protein